MSVRFAIRSTVLALAATTATSLPASAQETRVISKVIASVVNDVVREVTTSVDVATLSLRDREDEQDRRIEQTDRETKTLALGANGSLELRNVSGDISITAGTGRDVTIEIVRRSRGATDADARLGLDRVKVTVEQNGERGEVATVQPNERRPPYSVSVSLTVTAPAGTRVETSSISGNVTIKGMKGDQSVNVTSGNITVAGGGLVSEARTISGTVSLSDISTEGTVQAGTVSGDVILQRVKAARLEVGVTSGDVTARDITSANVELKSLSGSIDFAGAVSRSGRYELQTHSGTVHVAVTGGGFQLEATTFSGEIRPDAGLDMKGVMASRRALRGTVGDGSAVVIATTFSGNVTIGKK
jgi:DUF4097 and DUF4098 domain-containing protein YvlB